ncbi:unnamed protein product [Caenorhabditis nigoni]
MQEDKGEKLESMQSAVSSGEGSSSSLPVKEVVKEVQEAAKLVKMEKAKCEAKKVNDDEEGSSSSDSNAPKSSNAKQAARSRTDSGEDTDSSISQLVQRSPSPIVASDPPNTPEEKDPSPSEEEEEVSVNREDAPGAVEEQPVDVVVNETKKIGTPNRALVQKPILAVQGNQDQETTVATSASSAPAAREPRARRLAPSKRYPTDVFHVPDLGAPKKNKKT